LRASPGCPWGGGVRLRAVRPCGGRDGSCQAGGACAEVRHRAGVEGAQPRADCGRPQLAHPLVRDASSSASCCSDETPFVGSGRQTGRGAFPFREPPPLPRGSNAPPLAARVSHRSYPRRRVGARTAGGVTRAGPV
jgi:hypothetical protein